MPTDGEIVGPVVYTDSTNTPVVVPAVSSATAPYDPTTEWAERRARSRQRVQAQLAADSADTNSVGYQINPTPGLVSEL